MEKQKRKLNINRILLVLVFLLAAAIAALYLGREMQKRTYRLVYKESIAQYAEEFSLDPYLVAAIIHVESSNRPAAVSPSGAIGLMQVMPETGGWIAGKLNVEQFEQDDLFDPELNIRFGCWYLNFLQDRYGYNLPLTIAAYNAGQGTVDKWLQDPALSQGNTLHEIPYAETDNYLKKVQRAYEKYQLLYKKEF